MKKTMSAHFLFLVCCCFSVSYAQGNVEGLVINEVYFNSNDSSENWIEIHNPTKEPLMLSVFVQYKCLFYRISFVAWQCLQMKVYK